MFTFLSHNSRLTITLAALFLATAGCGSEYVTVTGTITLDGEPLQDAFVEFTPQVAGGSMAYGRTDAGGKYNMMFSLSPTITVFDVPSVTELILVTQSRPNIPFSRAAGC